MFKKKKIIVLKKRLKRYIGGLKGIYSFPSVVILVGQRIECTTIYECYKLQIPIICRLDTDCDPIFTKVGVSINDVSMSRICFFLETLIARVIMKKNV